MSGLRAPFPWFGGKSRAAHLVWQAFGADVPNYVEPFAGSLAVLLGRPGVPRIETVNDLDCYLANFWRAVQREPETVARWADWPQNEADMHARHFWLVYGDGKDPAEVFRERMKVEPEYFDAKRAGWWVWGLCMWIGGGWCALPKPGTRVERRRRPALGKGRRGATGTTGGRKTPQIGGTKGAGVHKRSLGRAPGNQFGYFGARAPMGLNARGLAVDSRQRPQLGTGMGLSRQIPDLYGSRGAASKGVHASGMTWSIYDWMEALCARLRKVRVCCGDWRRVLGPSPTTCIGTTAVLLDPPYSDKAGRDGSLYAQESLTVAHDVREWALANGDNPRLRIALCGYDGEHEMPESWQCVAWEAAGGYGSKANARKERIWFSPHCLTVRQQLQLWRTA